MHRHQSEWPLASGELFRAHRLGLRRNLGNSCFRYPSDWVVNFFCFEMKREATNPFESLRKLAKTSKSSKPKQETQPVQTEERVFGFTGLLPENILRGSQLTFIRLQKVHKLAFKGSCLLSPVVGTIAVNGYEWSNRAFQPVYSPSTASLIAITPSFSANLLDRPASSWNEQELQDLQAMQSEWNALDDFVVFAIKPIKNGLFGIEHTVPVLKQCFLTKNGATVIPGFEVVPL